MNGSSFGKNGVVLPSCYVATPHGSGTSWRWHCWVGGEGMMEPNGDGDGHAGKMEGAESPLKAQEGMVCTDKKEGTKEMDEPMEE